MAEERDEENLIDPDLDEIEVIYDEPEDEEEATVSDVEGETEYHAEEAEAGDGTEMEQLRELNDKYLRLYAEFENYRKRVVKDKEDIVKFANESILYELLPSLDHLEIALKHANDDASRGIVEGVEMTLRELYRTLEKFGLKRIEAEGQPFDPQYHHAVSQIERNDMENNMVVEEMRKGFLYGDKVLRASMVTVSVKPAAQAEEKEGEETDETGEYAEETDNNN